MKKIFGMLLIMFGLFYAYQFAFLRISKGHLISYEMSDENYKIKISETFRSNLKDEKNNYSLVFDVYGDKFYTLIYDDFKGISKVVKKVRYYLDNEYSCIFVQYDGNKILSDVMCKKDDTFFPFNNIENPSDNLVDFIASLAKDGYLINDFKENNDDSYSINNIEIVKSNLQEKQIIGIRNENYFYITQLDKKNDPIEVLRHNISENILEYYFQNFYLIANYNYNNDGKLIIDGINIYDLINGEKKFVRFDTIISSNSYFIGQHLNSAYIYDPIEHIEYELNVEDKQIIEVGNKETSIKYISDGEWKRVTYDDFELENIRFDDKYKSNIQDEKFEKIYRVGKEFGFYYFAEKVDYGYNIYRSSINDIENKTYLFRTTNAYNLNFIQNGIYYIKNDKIMYYSDKTGNRTILKSNDFLNNNITFGSYIK